MNVELLNILGECWQRLITPKEAYDKILSLKAESEIGASDATEPKHGTYAVDGECNASEVTDTDSEHTSSAAMEKITEAKKQCDKPQWHNFSIDDWGKCKFCGGTDKI